MLSAIATRNNLTIIFMFAIGASLWNMNAPYGLSVQSWHLVILFLVTIACITLAPLPIGAVMIIVLTIASLTKTLTLSKALVGFSSDTVWLIVAAFFLAKGFDKTGLGKKIAFYLVAKFGNSLIKLSYSFVVVDFILAPMTPSVISRGGGIIYPILKSLIDASNENVGQERGKKISVFLIQTAFHTNIVTSALFLTAMAANPLIVSLAKLQGVEITWNTWAIAAIVPGVFNCIYHYQAKSSVYFLFTGSCVRKDVWYGQVFYTRIYNGFYICCNNCIMGYRFLYRHTSYNSCSCW